MFQIQYSVTPGNEWRKPRRSSQSGDCVEVAGTDGAILVRDTKDRGGPVLAVPAGAWRSFARRVKSGA